MLRQTLFFCASILAVCGCGSEAGPAGPKGDRGDPGTQGDPGAADPSISAVTPAMGYLGRTVDLVVSGYGTAWAGDTTVTFSDPKIQVNKVTAGSETGLLVNVTIAPDATEGPIDVTVTDMVGAETYKGAFKVASPLEVMAEPAAGLPQGGVAMLRVKMLDTTTPFDDQAIKVMFGSTDVGLVEVSRITPFALDLMVESDVLAAAGGVNLTVMSGPEANAITSPRAAAFQVAARAPTALQSAMLIQGEIKTAADSLLYSYAPADANTHFIQFGMYSIDGFPVGMVVPKSGKLGDALGSFGGRFAMKSTSTDPLYFLLRNAPYGSDVPYNVDMYLTDTACTAMAETAGNVDPSTANAIATLPALVSGDLIEGMGQSDDWFKITVTGASMMTPKAIHVATGGDAKSDVIAEVFDGDGFTPLGYSEPDGMHKNLVISDITVDGTYYLRVTQGFQFDASHSAYELFVEVQ